MMPLLAKLTEEGWKDLSMDLGAAEVGWVPEARDSHQEGDPMQPTQPPEDHGEDPGMHVPNEVLVVVQGNMLAENARQRALLEAAIATLRQHVDALVQEVDRLKATYEPPPIQGVPEDPRPDEFPHQGGHP